ncbi:beta-1,6-N-acetylglucosaminyltransferase [Methylocella sp. CPCC 101449]|uniref:beta-1,6-N-acetylglucosaminyltransferase n=1 Tax=Methylocella sp. CPCC 101449 TaxID=2987531 RepID=UPI002890B670|nr:beta-1,6-N-acetylglucosaminyltransferase [Methylocella sp. CPCC 101449]MDT2021257.1 beta-1,6-N-acetylglucosaminyltransferase [Methylocella sp. CPCC 101449]
MIAYLILVHRFPEQFKRMFRAIYDPENIYVVHVDLKSGLELEDDIARFLSSYPSAEILPAEQATWGGYSLVNTELRGMAHLLKMSPNWSHFINLSGQDFPIKSQSYIASYLARHEGHEFIKVLDQREMRPETVQRIKEYVVELNGGIYRTAVQRSFLSGVTPYISNQWMIVSRAFCEFVCHSPEVDRYKQFYRNTFISDEGFFQTVMMNTSAHGQIINDDLRTIDWVPDGDIKLRPRTLTADDAEQLIASENLFARKFDIGVDDVVLDILENHIMVTLPDVQENNTASLKSSFEDRRGLKQADLAC